ncbi:hypothetical protein H8I69_11610 [Serratia fonticola]|uniref:hypothetical protein n=1 Tax=Serratia fonticola TaxID=47917 RepID=UPI0015C59CD2|nr:hypothetical protein [Serratia fonticola]MBC3379750.1 hypothetical protein [Serratia fonticola]NYA38949.1 hypothetical protein [Serratia fonticola]
MFSQPYGPQAATLQQPRWGRGLVYVLGIHLALVWLFYWPQTSLPPVLMPPSAIMLSWAAQIEAPSQPKPLPLGLQQQADSSAAQPVQQQREPEMPELARAEAAKIVVAERSKNAHKQQRKAPPKPPTPMEKEEQLISLVNYMLQVGKATEPEKLLRELARRAPRHVEELMTIAEYLEQKGFEKGLEKERETVLKIASSMLAEGFDRAMVMKLTGLSADDLAVIHR